MLSANIDKIYYYNTIYDNKLFLLFYSNLLSYHHLLYTDQHYT